MTETAEIEQLRWLADEIALNSQDNFHRKLAQAAVEARGGERRGPPPTGER